MTAEIRLPSVQTELEPIGIEFQSTLDSQFTDPPSSKRPCTPTKKIPRIPGYEIISELGRAGMGVVYEAIQENSNEAVAIKMLRDGAFAGAEQFERFYNEAQILSGFQHPNIVRIYEVGEQDGRLYMVLQLAEGGSLADYLNGSSFPTIEALSLIEILARATHYVHEHGILHRDLKPANILVQIDKDNGGAKVLPLIADFGLGKRSESTHQTSTGAILGTPAYMSPEQARGCKEEMGPGTDVYSLGAILYELLTGQPPFRGDTVIDTLDQVRGVEPVPPSRFCPELHPDIEAICLTCLRKDPKERYATAEELASELQRARQGKPLKHTSILLARGNPDQNTIDERVETALESVRSSQPQEALLWLADAISLEEKQGGSAHANRTRFHAVTRACPQPVQVWASAQAVTRAVIDPNGQFAITAQDNGQLHLLDLLSGEMTAFESSHSSNVNQIRFSADGELALTASDDCTAIVWDVVGRKAISPALKHDQWVTSAAFSHCEEKIVTTCADGTVWSWDWKEGNKTFPPLRHGGMLWTASYSPDGSNIISAGWDGSARVWDVRTGTSRIVVRHESWVRDACFSPNGRFFATASDDSTARIWSLQGEPITLPLRHDKAVRHVRFTEDGKYLFTWTVNDQLYIWEARTGKAVASQAGLRIRGGEDCSPDGRRYLRPTESGALYLFDLAAVSNDRLRVSNLEEEGDFKAFAQWSAEELTQLAELHLGKRLNQQGQLIPLTAEEAHDRWEKLIQSHPEQMSPSQQEIKSWHLEAIKGCTDAGFQSHALMHLTALLYEDSTQADWWAHRARLYLAAGNQAQALEDYSQALQFAEHEPKYLLARGSLYGQLNQWERTARDFKCLTEVCPDWAVAHQSLIRAHLHRGNTRLAESRLSLLLESQPENHKLHSLRAGVRAEQRDWNQAAADFTSAENLGDRRAMVLALHALVCLRKGDQQLHEKLSWQLLKQAEESNNPVEMAWGAWVATLSSTSEHAETALTLAKSCQSLMTERLGLTGFLRTIHAAALHRCGRSEEALEVLQESAGKGVQDWLWLAMIHHSLGQVKLGQRWLKKAFRWLKAPYKGRAKVLSLPWHQRAEIRILREEAQALLDPDPESGEVPN